MSKEITTISPEGVEVANNYLELGNISDVARRLQLPAHKVAEILSGKFVKRYIDAAFLDLGYRNRNNIANALDDMIESKLEEAKESGIYSSKDLADLLQMAHRMRMDEIKVQNEANKTEGANIKNQINIQNNDTFGQSSNYGKLMDKLINGGGIPINIPQ